MLNVIRFCRLSSIYFYVRAGTSNVGSGGQRVRVSSIIEHSGYNAATIDNDIAILKASTQYFFWALLVYL